MEGGAGTAMEVLLQNLINVTKEEIFLIRGLDKEAEQLKTTLMTIQGYLNDAEKNYITRDAVKAWLHELEVVAFEADDVLDEFNYHALHNKVKAMKTTCFSSLDHTLRPHHMARRIKEINTSFDSITKRASNLNLQTTFVDASASVPDFSLETDSYTLDPIFIGRDDDVPRLVEALTKNPQERILSILAVVGMGGMGKTTLTRKVFNRHEMKTRFGCHSWVYVSRTFNPLFIFKKFLGSLADKDKESNPLMLQKSFKAKTHEVETRQEILEKLKQALKNKTYLLVLDDVWNEDIMKWEDFIESLSGVTSTKGNGIIITTRSSEVASIVNPLQTHHLNGLSDEDCWSIIKAKVSEMGKLIPLEFETVGRKIARKCHGLPLAAKVVGGVLCHKSEQEWLSIEQKWLSDDDGDYISRILKLSYDNLSLAALKKCFAYCSIFPKGHRMEKQELIELWMAEGFLQPDERNDMECVGYKFVKVLLSSSLLQPANNDEETCVMHDLVHDLASSVLGSLKARYMWNGDESSHIPKESAKHLRTLFLEGEFSEFKLSDFKGLHVLNCGNGSHVVQQLSSSSIRKLIHLRRLDISETEIKYLPDSIGELHHLQTLRANTVYLKELPKTVKYLINLRHLYICEQINLPPKIGRLISLQTLTHFTVGHENGCQIEEFGSLKNLKGKLKIFNLENVKTKEEAKKANLFQNSNLLEFSFIWSYGRDEIDINDEEVLEGLKPHSNLKKLEIERFKGKKFPLWIMKMVVPDEAQGSWMVLKNLGEITLEECDECEEIPMLGLLPNLKHLYLRKLRKMKSLNSSFYGIGVGQETNVFPVLERLVLVDMFELREWEDMEFPESRLDEVKVFPSLLYLTISHCKQLRSIPRHSFGSLKELEIDWLDELECLPDGLFRMNQNLSKLRIWQCTKLREFPDGLGTLRSLEVLQIRECQNLKSVGNPIGQSQATLHQLWIGACKGLVELPHELVESWAPSLEKVVFWSLSNLNNLPKLIECLEKSTRLTYLCIVGVPKFMATHRVESWAFDSLRELRIDASV